MLGARAAALALGVILVLPPYTRAQSRADVRTSTQAVIGESGWTAYQRGEDLAIVGVHLYRQSLPANRHRSLAAVTRAYSSALNGNRPWILQLGRPGWPRGIPERFRVHYQATERRVTLFLRGALLNPCPTATHYGSRADGAPGPGYRRVCRDLGFRSHFWARRE